MGEQRRWVVSVDEETHRLAEQWQADFSPLVGNNRSSLVRLVFKTLDRLGFTAATLTAALNQTQQLRHAIEEHSVAELNNLSHEFPAQIAAPSVGRPPIRASEAPQHSDRRRRFAVKRQAVLATEAYTSHPFLASVRLYKSSNFRRVA